MMTKGLTDKGVQQIQTLWDSHRELSSPNLNVEQNDNVAKSEIHAKVIANKTNGLYEAVEALIISPSGVVALTAGQIDWNDNSENPGFLRELNNIDSDDLIDKIFLCYSVADSNGDIKWVFDSGGETGGGGGNGDAGDCEIIYAVTKETFDANDPGTAITFGDLTCFNIVLCPNPCKDFPTCSNGGPSMAISLFQADYPGANRQWIDTAFSIADIIAGTKKCLCADNWTDTDIQNAWVRSSNTFGGKLNIARLFISNPGSGRVRFEAGAGTVSSFASNFSPVCGNFAGSPVCNDGFPTTSGQLPIPDAYFFSYTQAGIVYTWERGSDWGC